MCRDRRERKVRDSKGEKRGGDMESRREDRRREWRIPRKKNAEERITLVKRVGTRKGAGAEREHRYLLGECDTKKKGPGDLHTRHASTGAVQVGSY